MARFDVYRFGGKSVSLVVTVQASLLDGLQTRVVIPLVPEKKAAGEALPRLKPVLEIKGKNYILMTTDIGTLNTKDLGAPVDNRPVAKVPNYPKLHFPRKREPLFPRAES